MREQTPSKMRKRSITRCFTTTPAVAGREATGKDGNKLRENLTQKVAVVICKPLTLRMQHAALKIKREALTQGLPEWTIF